MAPRLCTPAQHRAKVERVATQLKAWPAGRPLSLKKSSPSHQVPKPGDLKYSDDKLDVSDLDAIIEIDVEGRRCVAEPGVTFVDLVAATLEHGLVPYVVPELETITIGGAVSGCSIESMSFEIGGFHDNCLAYELLTGRGELLRCDPDGEDALVFHMMQGSFGTLGILTELTFRLCPAAPYVRVEYEKHSSAASYLASIKAHAEARDMDFMDGIIHGPDLYVLSLGHLEQQAPYTHRYDWVTPYYKTTASRVVDHFETPDYFFRYNRGVTGVRPRSWLARLLLGRWLDSTRVLALTDRFNHLLTPEQLGITVDLFIPYSRCEEFLAWYWAEFGAHPLWCVPYTPARDYPWIADAYHQRQTDEMFVDLAIYGFSPKDGRNYHRLIEEKLHQVNGLKTLIAPNYYGEDEFWTVFNRPNHFAVKARTDPDGLFRDLYTKTCRASRGLS